MDSRVAENKTSRPLRRSTRQISANVKALGFEATPRGPLKRTRKGLKKQGPVSAVNGSGDAETGSEDEESPSKKNRRDTGGAVSGSGDDNEMDVQESVEDLEKSEDQQMDLIQDSSHGTHQPKTCQDIQEASDCAASPGARGDMNLSHRVVLGERCRSSHAVNEDADWIKTKRATQSSKGSATPTKSASQIRPTANRHDVPIPKITSMADYKKKMEAKATYTGMPTVNHHIPSVYPASEKSYTTRQRMNNIPTQKEAIQHKKQGIKKTAVIKRSSGYSCRVPLMGDVSGGGEEARQQAFNK